MSNVIYHECGKYHYGDNGVTDFTGRSYDTFEIGQ